MTFFDIEKRTNANDERTRTTPKGGCPVCPFVSCPHRPLIVRSLSVSCPFIKQAELCSVSAPSSTAQASTARTWVIHWQNIDPTVKRYQHPVTLERVLNDHRAALAAVPMDAQGQG